MSKKGERKQHEKRKCIPLSRVPESTIEYWREAAHIAGEKLSPWLIALANKEAKRIHRIERRARQAQRHEFQIVQDEAQL
jgi:hypothetical protein